MFNKKLQQAFSSSCKSIIFSKTIIIFAQQSNFLFLKNAYFNQLRGKTNLIKQLNCNTDNWCRIQAKTLYIIQLWYDTFILEESKYSNIINTYKILRKQKITFPPRSKNQKNLMFVQTQSPIFDNIQQIAYEDQKKFTKKLNALGMSKLSDKFNSNVKMQMNYSQFKIQKKVQKKHINLQKQINIDQISQKIAIIQSIQFSTKQTLNTIQYIKKAIQFGKVKPNQQAYWKQIKHAAQNLVELWQQKNAQLIKSQQQQYLQKKLGIMSINQNNKENEEQIGNRSKKYIQNLNVDLLDSFQPQQEQIPVQQQKQNQFNLLSNQLSESNNMLPIQNKQIDLLDLL